MSEETQGIKHAASQHEQHTTAQTASATKKKTAKKAAANTKKASKENNMMVLKAIAAGVGIIVIALIIMMATKEGNTETAFGKITPKTGLPVTTDNSGIAEQTIVLGHPDAPITIYDYSEYLCPFCQRFHQETMPKLIDEYVKTG